MKRLHWSFVRPSFHWCGCSSFRGAIRSFAQKTLMNGGLSLAIPCHAGEPDLGAALKSLDAACQHPLLPGRLVRELTICINGLERGVECAPVAAVRAFCTDHDIPLQEVWVPPAEDLFQGETLLP